MSNAGKKAPRKPKRAKVCLFCGSNGPLTEEHVFGEWVKKLGYGGDGIREYVSDTQAPVIQQGGAFSKTLKIVCGPCNNAWMSGMEDAVKPLLIAMFNGGRVELDEAEQHNLARWAFKSVAVLAHVDGQQGRFPLEHCRVFRQTDEPPTGVVIRIGTASVSAEQHGLFAGQSRFLPRSVQMTVSGKRFDIPAYSARFRLLNVVFDVFGYSISEKVNNDAGLSPGCRFELHTDVSEDVERMLLQIWPPKNPTIWWPPAASLDTVGGIEGLEQTEQWNGIPTFLSLPAADATAES